MPFERWQTLGLAAALSAVAGYYFLLREKQPVLRKSSENEESRKPKNFPVRSLEEKDMPGYGLQKLGNGLEMAEDYGAALMLFAKRCTETGEGVGYVDCYGTPTLLVADAEIARKTLSHSVQHALWGGLTAASEAFFGKNVLFVLEGPQWRFLRSVMKHSLSKQSIELMQLDLLKTAEKFTSKIKPNKEIDMNSLLGLYHLSAIGKSAFDFDLDCLSDDNLGPNEAARNFEWFIDELPKRSLNPDQSVAGDYTSDNEANRKWNSAANSLRGTIKKVIDARLITLGIDLDSVEFKKRGYVTIIAGKEVKETRKDLLNAMLFSTLEASESETENGEVDFVKIDKSKREIKVTKEKLASVVEAITDNLVEMLFAGYNTNVGTMANLIHFLAMNNDVQKKCIEEVDNLFREMGNPQLTASFDFQKFLSILSLDKVKTIQNSFYETLRLRPPAPLVARLLSRDFEFAGQDGKKILLPAGMPLWVPIEYLQTHDDNWFQFSAKAFKPERFELEKPYKMGSYMPFSFGPRDCIGKTFALHETIAALVLLLRRFTFVESKEYKYKSFFNGFGYRPFDEKTNKVCMKVIPLPRNI